MIERHPTATRSTRDSPASAAPDLIIDSATGVGVALPIAGPGARAFAYIIDWCIRVVLSLAWYVVAALIYHGELTLAAPLETDSNWLIFVVGPSAAIYLLYYYVLEIGMRGRTPGKRMVGVRVAARDGSVPSIASIVIRNVFRLIDGFPLVYGVGILTSMFTTDHVRVGDMAAGTVLVYDRTAGTLLESVGNDLIGKRLDAATVEVINELLYRWTSLDPDARRRLAAQLLSRLPDDVSPRDTDWSSQSDEALRHQLERIARGTA